MNETIYNFLKLLNIDYEKFLSLTGCQIKTGRDINPIVSRFGIYKPGRNEMKSISIADVVGFSRAEQHDLISSLPNYFDKYGDGYHSRSASMLEISSEEIMQKLRPSFQAQPMHLVEVDKGIYNVGDNGMHRFHVLKIHYLDELTKLGPKDIEAKKRLREKYTFETYVSEIDFIKTYSYYVLSLINPEITVENERNGWNYTGNAVVTFDSQPDKEYVFTDAELLNFVKTQINSFLKSAPRKDKKTFKTEVKQSSTNYDSFKNYYDSNLSNNVLEATWKSLE